MTILASIVRISIPISDTRTKASITRPLSRITSITSASPLGRGRSRYPRGVAVVIAVMALPPLRLVRFLVWQGLFRVAHEVGADVRPVLGQRLRDRGLVDPVQVAD